jgi:DNA-binding response OmpR family regulator
MSRPGSCASIVGLSRSPKEFALLAYLYAHCGQVCSKDDIGDAVWPEYREAVCDYQIENLVRRLRERINVPADPLGGVI